MRRHLVVISWVAVALLGAPLWAEEIVHFTNGTSMPVVSHSVRDGMVHVDLGDNGFIAFPEYMVERIVEAGKGVALKPSYINPDGTNSEASYIRRLTGNRRVPTPEGSYPVQGFERDRKARGINKANLPTGGSFGVDEGSGLAYYKPMANHPAPNRRNFILHGNMRILSATQNASAASGGFGGTARLGSKHVIGGSSGFRSPGRSARGSKQLVSIDWSPSGAAAPGSHGRVGRLDGGKQADSGKGGKN